MSTTENDKKWLNVRKVVNTGHYYCPFFMPKRFNDMNLKCVVCENEKVKAFVTDESVFTSNEVLCYKCWTTLSHLSDEPFANPPQFVIPSQASVFGAPAAQRNVAEPSSQPSPPGFRFGLNQTGTLFGQSGFNQ